MSVIVLHVPDDDYPVTGCCQETETPQFSLEAGKLYRPNLEDEYY